MIARRWHFPRNPQRKNACGTSSVGCFSRNLPLCAASCCCSRWSAGWQRRLALGRMLLLDAPLLLLDEAAAGLDVRARAELLEIVRGLSGIGRTVVISSHILPELEELADRFGIAHSTLELECAAHACNAPLRIGHR